MGNGAAPAPIVSFRSGRHGGAGYDRRFSAMLHHLCGTPFGDTAMLVPDSAVNGVSDSNHLNIVEVTIQLVARVIGQEKSDRRSSLEGTVFTK